MALFKMDTTATYNSYEYIQQRLWVTAALCANELTFTLRNNIGKFCLD